MSTILSKSRFDRLLQDRFVPSVSLYIPTFRAGSNQEDRLRWKNIIKEASHNLEKQGFGDAVIKKVMRSAQEDLDDQDLWLHMSDGYCAFLSESEGHAFKIPIHFESFQCVTDRFFLSPLLAYFQNRQRFFLLALSRGGVKFFEGNKHSITPVEISDLVPDSRGVFLESKEYNLQYHTAGGDAIYHGEGGKEEQGQKDDEKHLRAVDDGLMKMLYDEKAPMILTGGDNLCAIYRDISRYNNILDNQVAGDHFEEDPVVLHEVAWEIIEKDIIEPQGLTTKIYEEMQVMDKTSSSLEDISQHAKHGRIDTLIVRQDFAANIPVGDAMLINKSIIDARSNGSNIEFRDHDDMPETNKMLNAVLRY